MRGDARTRFGVAVFAGLLAAAGGGAGAAAADAAGDRAVGAKPKPVTTREAGRRWAFLVGINEYVNHPRLKYCRQDCVALRDTLVKRGRFEPGNIVMLTDDAPEKKDQPTFGQIYARLPHVLEVAEKGDLAFVYLSGHGAQFEDEKGKHGYFIPLDGAGRQTSIPLAWVNEQLEACKASQKVLILDACRNDVVDATRETRSLAGSIVADTLGKTFVTLFSCDAGQRSSEYDRGPNGVFTHFLLEGLGGQADKDRDGRIDLYEAHLYARARTQQWGLQKGRPQSPILKGEIADPVVLAFVRPGEPAELLVSSEPPKEFTNSVGMKMVLIPAGEFVMGSPDSEEGRDSDEGPQHRVRIAQPFYMATCEVTVGQFRRFVEATGYRTDAEKGVQSLQDGKTGGYTVGSDGTWGWWEDASWRNPGFAQTDDHPVVLVSWNDARAFCAWLSRTEGREYRLPTEAEWEYACRAGTETEYWWGDEMDRTGRVANVADRSAKRTYPEWEIMEMDDGSVHTAPVGSYRANGFGLRDMIGNVWEWCEDVWHEGYAGAPTDGSAWVSGGKAEYRVLRGGSWGNDPGGCRSALRGRLGPDNRSVSFGLRVVVSMAARGTPG